MLLLLIFGCLFVFSYLKIIFLGVSEPLDWFSTISYSYGHGSYSTWPVYPGLDTWDLHPKKKSIEKKDVVYKPFKIDAK